MDDVLATDGGAARPLGFSEGAAGRSLRDDCCLLLFELLLLHGRRRGLSPAVPDRPLLAPWYRIVEDGDRLLLEHGQAVVVLEGGAVRTLLPALLPLLDGTRTTGELAEELGASSLPAVGRTLELLAENGLLVEGPEAGGVDAVAIAAAYRIAPSLAAERLRDARIGVVGDAGVGLDVARLLRRAGAGEVTRLEWSSADAVDLAVVTPAPGDSERVEAWNLLALETGTRWLSVRPFDGAMATVGPLVVPHESACHGCLLLRLASHLEYAGDFPRVESTAVRAGGGTAIESIVAGAAAHLVLGWVVGHNTRLPGLLHLLGRGPAALAHDPHRASGAPLPGLFDRGASRSANPVARGRGMSRRLDGGSEKVPALPAPGQRTLVGRPRAAR